MMLTTSLVKDLWVRGYSDTPLGVPHDARLYETQIFFAAASSSLSWTEAEPGGFSLRGGIAMAFAVDFPYLINSIVLLALGGIIRRPPKEYETVFFHYPYLLPSSYLRNLVGKTLELRFPDASIGCSDLHNQSQLGLEIVQEAQVTGCLDVAGIVRWQFENRKGFIHSFISTHQYVPIKRQHSDHRRVCSVIRGDPAQTLPLSHSSKLFNSKILVIFGEADSLVREKEVSAGLLGVVGNPENVEFIRCGWRAWVSGVVL